MVSSKLGCDDFIFSKSYRFGSKNSPEWTLSSEFLKENFRGGEINFTLLKSIIVGDARDVVASMDDLEIVVIFFW